jgi:protein phosphatase PTC7
MHRSLQQSMMTTSMSTIATARDSSSNKTAIFHIQRPTRRKFITFTEMSPSPPPPPTSCFFSPPSPSLSSLMMSSLCNNHSTCGKHMMTGLSLRCFSSVQHEDSASYRGGTPKDDNNDRVNKTSGSKKSTSKDGESSSDGSSKGLSPDDLISAKDEQEQEQYRRRLRDVPISEVLKAKHAYRWVDPVIYKDATLKEAIQTCIEGGLSGMMVVEPVSSEHPPASLNHDHHNKRVAGLITSRDLLRIMAAGLKNSGSAEETVNQQIGKYMTPISQVVYGRPDETVGICRTIMAKLGIKCLPILSKEGQVAGLITARDISDFGLSAKDKGGKKSYLDDLSGRVGLSSETSMAEPPTYMNAHLALEQSPLYVNIGIAELPHPWKTHDEGVGSSQRNYGPRDPTMDVTLSEDAHFSCRVYLADDKDGAIRDVTYFGVADGVGSWRQYGVNPREFSHKLMEECQNILLEACHKDASVANRDVSGVIRRMMAPVDILAQAHERVKAANIIGSSTACVALFDSIRHQLHFSNLGDSGIIVLRHIDSDVAGSLKRDRTTPRTERTSDLRVAFISQQQLFSFNHPYQMGWTGEELGTKERTSFKTAVDSCTTSIHVRRGDIIIMATDGLFDNVEIDDIAKIGLEWEQKWGFIRGGDIAARERRWEMGNSLTVLSSEQIGGLAEALVEKAREMSLDSSTDSPFALLAKENDIMWNGGMPDDCTVIVAHVVGRAADDTMDAKNQ